jgi:hypothetical protein
MKYIVDSPVGGYLDVQLAKDKFAGLVILLHVDQTDEIGNGEGEASIALTKENCKNLVKILNDFIELNL